MKIDKLSNITFALGFRYYRVSLCEKYLHVLNIFYFYRIYNKMANTNKGMMIDEHF